MVRFLRNIALSFLIVCLLLCTLVAAGQKIPYQSDKSYYAAMRDKYYANLNRTEPGIVLVGGSNLAFGVDTEKISKHFNMPALNMGFHAGLKRDFFLNVCKKNIMKGDIIILAFEYSAYSEDLMSEDITWYTVDNCIDLMRCVPSSNVFNLVRYYPIYLIKKIKDSVLNPHPIPENRAYSYDCFNEYGDNVYRRYENLSDKEEIRNTAYIEIKKDIVSDESVEAFVSFKKYCESKGARVYASCPSVDEYAVKYIENKGEDFKKYYEEKTGIKMISHPSEYILPTTYFYDSDYHLNLNGVAVRTDMLIRDIETVF